MAAVTQALSGSTPRHRSGDPARTGPRDPASGSHRAVGEEEVRDLVRPPFDVVPISEIAHGGLGSLHGLALEETGLLRVERAREHVVIRAPAALLHWETFEPSPWRFGRPRNERQVRFGCAAG
jgi:hypothetical protein